MSATAYLVVGLGNPGATYRDTPHNAGFTVVDRLAATADCDLRKSRRFPVRIGRAALAGNDVWLMQPQTFMNRSGDAVAPWVRYHRLAIDRLVVVVDDIDLPLGTLRIRAGGGHGGHNGLRSIMEQLATDAFPRVRVGVGRGRGNVVSHVLTPFSREENECFQRALDRSAQAVSCLLVEGVAEAMNRFNGCAVAVEPGREPSGPRDAGGRKVRMAVAGPATMPGEGSFCNREGGRDVENL